MTVNNEEEKEAVEWLKGKLVSKQPPKHQHTGPFSKGPRAFVPCPMCTSKAVADDPKFTGTIGTSKQHQRQHLKDHREARLFLKKAPVPV
jgi:hypothetical protein